VLLPIENSDRFIEQLQNSSGGTIEVAVV